MTVEELIKASGTRNPLAKGSTKLAQKMLNPDEKLYYAINTNFRVEGNNEKLKTIDAFRIKGKLNGVVAVTSKRVFFCNNVLGHTTSKEMSIDSIQSVDDTSDILTNQAIIRIKGLTEIFIFNVPKKIQQDFKSNVVKAMKNSNVSNSALSLSAADELRKFKNLLDTGAITWEEYDKKKKELLYS